MPAIPLDAAYAPELVEFWAHKYKEVKEELDKLKSLNAETDQARAGEESAKFKELANAFQADIALFKSADVELRKMLKFTRDEELKARKRLEIVEEEKRDLNRRLAKVELERSSLSKQVLHFYSQATALASEADRSRRCAISKLFPPDSFIDPSFEPALIHFDSPQVVTAALPSELTRDISIYCLPRPPSCMPLRVPSCGQPGYWFFPVWVPSKDTEFELVVEGHPGEWSYLGRYVSAPLEDHPMQLSEWLSLDEQTKYAYCVRISSRSLPPGQIAPYPAQIEVKRKYEMGEWNVPCYSLRCVGFNIQLYDALQAAATVQDPPSSCQTASNVQIGTKKRRMIGADAATRHNKRTHINVPSNSESEHSSQPEETSAIQDQDTNLGDTL